MANRSYFVKMNLDEVGHAVIEYDEPADMGRWFKGFLVGAHGKPLKPCAHPAYQAGHAYGLAASHDADAFRAKQAANGALGGRPVKPNESQTIPNPYPNESQTITQTKPIQQPEVRSQKSESKNENPGAREGDPFTGPSNPISPPDSPERWPMERREPWASGLVEDGCKIGPNNWPAWKKLVETHGNEKVREAASGLKADDRWPDKTENAIKSRGSQTGSVADAIKHKIVKVKV